MAERERVRSTIVENMAETIYPSGGHYPETHEGRLAEFKHLFIDAEPDGLNRLTQLCLHDGNPKFVLLGRALLGEISLETLYEKLKKIDPIDHSND